jgi:hypothetical protein
MIGETLTSHGCRHNVISQIVAISLLAVVEWMGQITDTYSRVMSHLAEDIGTFYSNSSGRKILGPEGGQGRRKALSERNEVRHQIALEDQRDLRAIKEKSRLNKLSF